MMSPLTRAPSKRDAGSTSIAVGCVASLRTGFALWWDKIYVLLKQALTLDTTLQGCLDARTLEPRILYSASTVAALSDCGELAANCEAMPIQHVAMVPLTDLIVIDARVAKIDQLIADMQAADAGNHHVEFLTLNRDEDAIKQITARLETLQHVGSIQIYSHGNDGQLVLGDAVIDASNIDSYATAFSRWKQLVQQDADLRIYSCNVAATDRGTDMLQQISQWTGMDVAASRDLTGALSGQSNWELEYTIGSIQSRNWLSETFKAGWTELLPTIQVTTDLDVVDGNTTSLAALLASPGSDQSISLREAILAANATQGSDVIVLASGTYRLSIQGANEGHADTGDLNIQDSVELLGTGLASTTIEGLSTDRLFNIDNHATVSMSNMTLVGGNAPSNRDGGAILIQNSSSLSLNQVRIHQNTALAGGAIYVDQSTLSMTRSQLDHNHAIAGGAIYNRDGVVIINQSTLALNTATQRGGAIYSDSSGVGLRLSNVTISSNTANIQGGAIFSNGNVAMNQSTIAFNQSTSIGGIANSNSSTTIQNTILANNVGGNASATLQSSGNNLSDQSMPGLDKPSDLTGDAALMPLGNYGGYGWTHLLRSSSAAIDAAAPAASTSFDQRGLSRDASPDIGAVEYQRLASTTDFLVNITTTNHQVTIADGTASGLTDRNSHQSVAMSADGSYVVVWSSFGQDGSGWSVIARRFDASGIALTGEVPVNQFTSGDQKWARVATDSQGNFIVTWTSVGQDGTSSSVYARRFDSQANALGNEFRVNATNTGDYRNSVIAIDPQTSAFTIAFESNASGSDTNIAFRRFDANGVALGANDVQANAVNRGQERDAAIATLVSGKMVIAWTVNQQIYLQRFNSSGAMVDTETALQASGHLAATPALGSDSSGNYLVSWQDTANGSSSLLGKLFHEDGSLKKDTFTIAPGLVSNPSIAMAADGNFTATWQRDTGSDGLDVFTARFDEQGNRIGNEELVNQARSGDQYLPSVASLDSTQFVVIWSGEGNGDASGVFARQFGTAIGVNQVPTANIQGVLSIAEGDGLQLNASNSFDPDGSIVSYDWDMNLDGVVDFTGSNITISWAQLQSLGIQTSSATPYTISLRVVDNLGWSNTANAVVTVGDTLPSITVTGTGNAIQQNDYTVSFSAFDPGVESISKWIVNWGDGTADELNAGSSVATHRYSTAGNFSVLVQLQDGDGIHDAVIHQVTVVAGNAAPIAVNDSFNIAHGGSISGATVTWWFDDDWNFRRLLQVPLVDNSVSLTNHPILLRLHATASDAIRVDYSQFAANGNDLRFVDLSGNQLAYQIESWNTNGYSSIWVNIPQLQTANDQNQFYMYYGNSGAAAGATSSAVWNSQYVGVYHLNSDTADSTTNALNGTGSSLMNVSGQIAGGKLFNGTHSALDLGSATQLDNLFDGGGSVSAWIYLFGWGENGFGRILDKSDSTNAANGFAFQVAQTAGSDGQLIFDKGFSGSVGRWRTPSGSISLFQWHFVTLAYDSSSTANVPSIYIDGVQQTLAVSSVPTGTRQSDATSSMTIGNRDNAPDRTFFGVIDEVRLSHGMESSQWVMQTYRSAESAPVTQLQSTEHPLSVRSNDSDAEGDPLLVTLVTGPVHASSFTLTAAGTFSYQHNGNYATQDSFVYRITDSSGGTSMATAIIQIASVNTAPTVTPLLDLTIAEDSGMHSVAFGIDDIETSVGSLVVFASSSDPTVISNGQLTLNGSGAQRQLLFTPSPDASGASTITLTVSDGTVVTSTSFVVTVSAVNDAPVANDDLIKQVGRQDIVISLTTLLSNDSDLDGDTLQWFQDTQPSHGRLELAGDTLRYIAIDFGVNSDAFTYRVFDGMAWSQPVTVQLELDPDAFAGYINLAINAGENSSNIVTSSINGSTTNDNVESQIDIQITGSKAETPQSEVSNAGASSGLALQVSMAMVAQSVPHASPGHGSQNSDLVSILQSNEAVVHYVDGTNDNEFDPDRFTNQTQHSASSYKDGELGGAQQTGFHSQWMNSVQTTGLPQPLFWEKIGELRQELRSSLSMQSSFTVGTAATTTAGMTVGYVAWVMRSGLLFSSMMTQLPIWRFMDPLAILESTEAEESEGDNETINSMVDGDWEADEPVAPETAENPSSQT